MGTRKGMGMEKGMGTGMRREVGTGTVMGTRASAHPGTHRC